MIEPEELYKLSENFFNISIEDRNKYYTNIKDIIDNGSDNASISQEILKFIVDIFKNKKIEMASGSLNINAPKKKGSFSRVGAERTSVFSKEDDCITTVTGVASDSKIIILK